MMKAYNYTIVENHKQKLYIPYFGIEFSGWGILILMLGGFLVGYLCIGLPLSFVLSSGMSILITAIVVILLEMIILLYINEENKETGKNKLFSFYYEKVKKYNLIYDQQGEKHFISRKKEGVIYYNVR